MKCQKCGKSEVNFHYTANINGCVTETHLCLICAKESGYDIGQMLDTNRLTGFDSIFGNNMYADFNSMFDRILPVRGISGFVPMAVPMIAADAMFPFTLHSRKGMINKETPCSCGCEGKATLNANVEADEEMSKRRELNAAMRIAVENEEFEKAAELRDQIRELEAGRSMKCDSETTSQDSPPVQ